MERTIAFVTAGVRRVEDLSVLTLRRPMSALPFAGMYRLIDFVLTNLRRSRADVIGLIPQYRPAPLVAHVGTGAPWHLAGRRRGVRLLPPQQQPSGSHWYLGTADAIQQNRHFILQQRPELVAVISGGHIYGMDYRPLLAFHRERRAALTVAFARVPPSEAPRHDLGVLAPDGRVLSLATRPAEPPSDLASMNLFVFDRDVLLSRLAENAREGRDFRLDSEVVPRMVREDRVFGYVFAGHWNPIQNVADYYSASLGLVTEPPVPDIEPWAVRTNTDVSHRAGDLPPARFGPEAEVRASVVSPGARVDGAVIESVLSPGVHVERGARVERSILFHECRVRADAVVSGAIADKWVRIGAGARVGVGSVPQAPGARGVPRTEQDTSTPVVLLGRATEVPDACRIGLRATIYPDATPEDLAPAVFDDAVVRPARAREESW